MLVLLIIFMVAAPLLTVGVPVELPKSAAGALPVDQEEPLTITITAGGSVQLQTTEVPRTDLVVRRGDGNYGRAQRRGLFEYWARHGYRRADADG